MGFNPTTNFGTPEQIMRVKNRGITSQGMAPQPAPAAPRPQMPAPSGGLRRDNPGPYFRPDGSINPIYNGQPGPPAQTPGPMINPMFNTAGPQTAPLGGAPGPSSPGMTSSPLPQIPPPGQMPTNGPQGPAMPPSAPNPVIGQILDPTPYNNAVNKGMGFLGSIPTTGNSLLSASPAFRGMSQAGVGQMNQQFAQHGGDLRNQAGLEFSRKSGAEVPRMMLNQLLGLRGLENETFDLQNEYLRNDTQRALGGITPILKLLGAFGNFF